MLFGRFRGACHVRRSLSRNRRRQRLPLGAADAFLHRATRGILHVTVARRGVKWR